MIYFALASLMLYNVMVRFFYGYNPKFIENRFLKCLLIIPPQKVAFKPFIAYMLNFIFLLVVCLFYMTGWYYIGGMHNVLLALYIIIFFASSWWSGIFDRHAP